MRLIKYFHSCFLVENGDKKILFDPGNYSFVKGRISPNIFNNLDAILITHCHPDHLDINALKIIQRNNPGAMLFANPDTKEILNKDNIACTVFESGEKKIGDTRIRAISADHEQLLTSVPHNTAFLINESFLITGDSLSYKLRESKGIKVLALPILGPWAKMPEIAEFAQSIQAQHIIPCHDGFVLDQFLERQYNIWKEYFDGGWFDFRIIKTGESFEF